MHDNREQIRLYTWRKKLLMIIAVITGITFAGYRIYCKKGYFTWLDITGLIITSIVALTILVIVSWWANRPEEGKQRDV